MTDPEQREKPHFSRNKLAVGVAGEDLGELPIELVETCVKDMLIYFKMMNAQVYHVASGRVKDVKTGELKEFIKITLWRGQISWELRWSTGNWMTKTRLPPPASKKRALTKFQKRDLMVERANKMTPKELAQCLLLPDE